MRAVAITIGIAVGGVILAAGDGTPGCSTPVPRVSFPYAAVLWLPGQPNYVLKTPNSNQHQAEVGVKLGPGAEDQDPTRTPSFHTSSLAIYELSKQRARVGQRNASQHHELRPRHDLFSLPLPLSQRSSSSDHLPWPHFSLVPFRMLFLCYLFRFVATAACLSAWLLFFHNFLAGCLLFVFGFLNVLAGGYILPGGWTISFRPPFIHSFIHAHNSDFTWLDSGSAADLSGFSFDYTASKFDIYI